MPVYRVTIAKQLIDGPYALQPWSNVYHLNDSSMASALLHAPVIVDLEKTLYPDNVRIFRYSISDPAVPNTGTSKTISESGNRSTGTVATQLPLFNCVLAKLIVTSGRPSPKYLRVVLDESEVDTGAVVGTLITAIETNFTTPLVNLGYVTDESGNLITDALVMSKIQMRQTGWHRRTRPGQKRGWVPA
jgi:hypothetical protein